MKKKIILVQILTLFISLFAPSLIIYAKDHNGTYPPFHIKKISPEEQTVKFWFKDTENNLWDSQANTKPWLLITGRWQLRHDLKKWAQFLNENYGIKFNIIWIFNPSGTKFSEHREKAINAFEKFGSPIPVAIDNHSFIGRSLKVEYDIPTIIGINKKNLLKFVFEGPTNKANQKKLEILIRNKFSIYR